MNSSTIPSPKFTLSKKVVLEQYNKVREVVDILGFSSKTNPRVSPMIEENTDGFLSVHMINELKHVKDMSRVLFLAQGWTSGIVEDLYERGIRSFAVDNEFDLEILLSTIEPTDWKITLLLRLKLKEHSLRTERYFVFGMSSDIINERVAQLKDTPHIEKLGVHFHRKTQNVNEWKIQQDIEDVLSEETLEAIDILNIGGGLPSEYANTNVDVIGGIFRRITELREWLHEKDIQLMIEPGRFISAPAGKLITYITGVYDNNIIVNASVYNSDMDAILVPVKLRVDGEVGNNAGKPYVIKGCTPCSMDLFRYRVYLKDKPKIGDEIVFINAGAYNFTSNFCDLEEIPTEIIE
ncbi:ornithine decarboxylase [Methanococcoides vulcani]|uniref:Ornithine decarboxylase n=1 Tax=Methanococcoides vulcani TaxID=1353158 RepID=A0A1H9Z1W7_9EURY|nr:decarboxylase [Methanococcoides vulcani]SES74861.1 ornithine decarboxylase [Methanococcoides vulcani]